MKKIIFLTLILTLLISACAAPTLIATSTPIPNTPLPTSTATATPVPTETQEPSPTPTEVPVKYDAQTLDSMSPEQVMASVPETAGYEKQYQGGFYVYYVNPNGELGAAYNLETGENVEIPKNLQTLTELPTKIENADSYPEVDVKDLPAFVAWLHYKYDAQAKNLKPYPFVEKEYTLEAKRSVDLRGWGVFFSTVESMDRYALFPGMVKIMDGNDSIFWGFPRLIKDESGNSRVLLASDAWDDMLNDPSVTNSFYYRLTSNPALRDKWQIAKFSDNKELACNGYQKISPSYDARYEMCSLYLRKYYTNVKREVASIIATGNYPHKLEGIPVFMTEDTTSFHVGN